MYNCPECDHIRATVVWISTRGQRPPLQKVQRPIYGFVIKQGNTDLFCMNPRKIENWCNAVFKNVKPTPSPPKHTTTLILVHNIDARFAPQPDHHQDVDSTKDVCKDLNDGMLTLVMEFRKTRQHSNIDTHININEMKKNMDAVEYDEVHLQKAIINRTGERVRMLLDQEELMLWQRREKLQRYLKVEKEELNRELALKQAMIVCGNCKDRETKVEKLEEQMEENIVLECLKALEREKIAKGMQCTKKDEIQLREMQKIQMQEKKRIQQKQAEIDELWHQELLKDVRLKEENERMKIEKLKQEMIERRLAYDEQIASATRKRREEIQNERDSENIRLDKMKTRMQQDYYDTIKRKRDQHMVNKENYIEGYRIKMSQIRTDKMKEREMDIYAIQVAKEELRREKLKKLNQIQIQKAENKVFVENFNHERMIAKDLKKETNIITNEWKIRKEQENDRIQEQMEVEKQNIKMKAIEAYKRHTEELKREMKIKRKERSEAMEKVRQTAYHELRKNLDSANDELKRQTEYRNALKNQIKYNQRLMELDLDEIERKQQPFTKKAIMFKEAMEGKVNHLCTSENPVHPFKKVMKTLPSCKISFSFP